MPQRRTSLSFSAADEPISKARVSKHKIPDRSPWEYKARVVRPRSRVHAGAPFSLREVAPSFSSPFFSGSGTPVRPSRFRLRNSLLRWRHQTAVVICPVCVRLVFRTERMENFAAGTKGKSQSTPLQRETYMKSRLLLTAAMVLIVGATSYAQDPVKDTEKAAQDAAHAAKKAAKKTTQETERAASAVRTVESCQGDRPHREQGLR